jgi:hypothetical protein
MEDDQTRIVWITMLALADKNGEIQGSVPGIARMSGVPVDSARDAITKFLSPDPDSRTKDDEGRRLEVIEGGWSMINYQKYREMASREEMRSAEAKRKARYRAKKKRNDLEMSQVVPDKSQDVPETMHKQKQKQKHKAEEKEKNNSTPSIDRPEVQDKAVEVVEDIPKFSLEYYIEIGAAVGIPVNFCTAVHIDLSQKGFKDAKGSDITSPALHLKAVWDGTNKKQTDSTAQNGARPAWQIDQDIVRTKEEIQKLQKDQGNKNISNGHILSKDKHKAQFLPAWLDRVQRCFDEARTVLPAEFKEFEVRMTAERQAISHSPSALEAFDSKEFQLNQFAQGFKDDDVPGFDHWDKTFNKARMWRDPQGLTVEARTELRMLKVNVGKLEGEKKAALLGV